VREVPLPARRLPRFHTDNKGRDPVMAVERTLSIIKPDATARNVTGKINAFFEEGGLRIVAQKRLRLTKEYAQKFYAVHAERAFYDELCDYMCSGPVVVQVLEGENAILRNREIMGATNPANAADGTVRKAVGLNVQENSVHGSDSPENAVKEIAFFFSETEIAG
jgi:nucleoside-diphosphate kinase